MNSLPPLFTSESFNSNAFTNGDVLSLRIGDSRYLKLTGGILTGSLTVSSSLTVSGQTTLQNATTTGLTVSGTSIYTDTQTVNKSSGDLIILNSSDTNGRSTLKLNCSGIDCEIGLRASLASTAPSNYYRYGAGSYRFVQSMITGNSINYGQLTINTSGSHLNFVNGSESSLIEHGLSSLRISSSVCPALLSLTSIGVNISSNGNHLTLRNGSQTSFFEETSVGILRTVSGLSMNLDSNGLRVDSLGNTNSARSRLDLGDSVSNKTLGIYNNGTSFYGLSANNNQLQFSSNSAFSWFTACTDSSPVNTNRLTLASNGVLTLTENAILPKGFFVQNTSFSGSGRVGIGLACHMANSSFAELFTWDYTNSLWKDMKINNTMYVNGTNSFVQIGANPGNPIYPLAVSGNFTTSFAGSYGYLNSGGAGSGSSTGSVPVTCFLQHRLWCSEVNAFSDRRLKEDFSEVSSDDAIDFIKTVKAKNYNWRADKTKKQCTGYVAQDILKFGKFDDLVTIGPDEDLEEEIDEDGFINPAKHRFLVSYQSAVPILHAAISQLIERIELLEEAANKPKRVRKKKND